MLPAVSRAATSGTVTTNAVDGGYATGSYTLLFGSDKVEGRFKIPLCPVLVQDVTKTRTCEPAT